MAGKKQTGKSGGSSGAQKKNEGRQSSGTSKKKQMDSSKRNATLDNGSAETSKAVTIPNIVMQNISSTSLPDSNQNEQFNQIMQSNDFTNQMHPSGLNQSIQSLPEKLDVQSYQQNITSNDALIEQPKNIADLSPEERKKIRQFRFQNGGTNDTTEILKEMESQKNQKLERAERFGVESSEVLNMKKNMRQERFKGPSNEDDEKRAQRLARFGSTQPGTAGNKSKRTNLEFTLDEYKIKNKISSKSKRSFKNKGKKLVGRVDKTVISRDKNKFNKSNKFKTKSKSGNQKNKQTRGKTLNVNSKFRNKKHQFSRQRK